VINIDLDQRNADWIKTTAWEFSTDRQMFLWQIGGPEHLAHFMTLPVAEAMPPELRAELQDGGTKAYNLALDALEAFGFSVKFDDSQPRDENGRWTAGGGGEPAATFHEQTAAWADQNLHVEPYLHTVQKIAVQEYTRTGWEHINSALRREGGPFTDAAGNSLTDIEQRDVANIALAIDGSPLPEDLVMWRGASELPVGFRPGATFYDQAFTSASLSRDVAQSFAGDGYTVRIEAPAGTKALYAGSMDATSHDETEMLLGRAQPFTVQSIDEASKVVSVRAGRA
jgi:hypothetical protein